MEKIFARNRGVDIKTELDQNLQIPNPLLICSGKIRHPLAVLLKLEEAVMDGLHNAQKKAAKMKHLFPTIECPPTNKNLQLFVCSYRFAIR